MALPLLLAVASGCLYVFSFAPWDQGWLQWIAFVPLFIGAQKLQEKEEARLKWFRFFLLGWATAIVITLGGFYWMVYSIQNYGGLPLPAALAIFVLFCFIGQLQVPLYLTFREWAKTSRRLDSSAWMWPVLSGLVYVGIEATIPKLFADTSGNAFYKMPWIRQAVDLGGPWVLSALSMMGNEWIARAILFKEGRSLASALALIAAISGYGAFRTQQFSSSVIDASPTPTPVLRFSLLQANIGDFLKLESERGNRAAIDQVLQAYLQLGTGAVSTDPKPDLIVWPETAYPTIFGKPHNETERNFEFSVLEFTRKFGGTFAFGGYDQDRAGLEYNSFFFWDAAKSSLEVYHKHHLLMFGETLPFSEFFPSMKNWFPTMGFFGRGAGPQVVSIRNSAGHGFRLAPSICYEALFPEYSVKSALEGADALINVTNDSWFGAEGEPYLHLALTTYRSIETRLPMIRSTNTGFSVLIDPTGEIQKSTSLFQAEVLNGSITPSSQIRSPYLSVASVFGASYFLRGSQLMTLILGLLLRSRRKRLPE